MSVPFAVTAHPVMLFAPDRPLTVPSSVLCPVVETVYSSVLDTMYSVLLVGSRHRSPPPLGNVPLRGMIPRMLPLLVFRSHSVEDDWSIASSRPLTSNPSRSTLVAVGPGVPSGTGGLWGLLGSQRQRFGLTP